MVLLRRRGLMGAAGAGLLGRAGDDPPRGGPGAEAGRGGRLLALRHLRQRRGPAEQGHPDGLRALRHRRRAPDQLHPARRPGRPRPRRPPGAGGDAGRCPAHRRQHPLLHRAARGAGGAPRGRDLHPHGRRRRGDGGGVQPLLLPLARRDLHRHQRHPAALRRAPPAGPALVHHHRAVRVRRGAAEQRQGAAAGARPAARRQLLPRAERARVLGLHHRGDRGAAGRARHPELRQPDAGRAAPGRLFRHEAEHEDRRPLVHRARPVPGLGAGHLRRRVLRRELLARRGHAGEPRAVSGGAREDGHRAELPAGLRLRGRADVRRGRQQGGHRRGAGDDPGAGGPVCPTRGRRARSG